MKKKIILKVLIIYIIYIFVFLFLPAGSFDFWEAWLYSLALFIPMVVTMIYLIKKDPALLKRRMKYREKEKEQKIIVKLFSSLLIIGYLLPGLDYRYNWSEIPAYLVVAANIMVLLSYFWVFLVFKENTYASRIIEVEQGQKVISKGPYSIIRHPMYTGVSLLFLLTPIALGSWWAIIIFILMPLALIIRIFNEEKVLVKGLEGYEEYCQKVRYRLIPYIW